MARIGLLRRIERSAATLVQPLVRPQRQSLRLAQAIAALLIIVSLVSAGTLRVAADSLPDSPLYPIKRATEWVQLALTTSPAGKAKLHISYFERRLEETQDLWEANKSLSEITLQDMERQDDAARMAISQAPEEERFSLGADLALLRDKQQETLEAIKAEMPPSDQGIVEEALEASEEREEIATGAMPSPTDTVTPVPPTDTAVVYARVETSTPVPTATPVPPTATPIPMPTAKPTATPVPAPTETPVPTPQVVVPVQPTVEPPATATPQVEMPSQPTVEPSVEPSPTLTATPSPTPTVTPTSTPTAVPTPMPTAEPTATPTPEVEVPSQPVPDPSIANCRVSDAPQGAEVREFPSGTRKVYIVFDYAYMAGEEIKIRVKDSVGNILFVEVRTLSGNETESIPFSVGEGGLAAGRYVVTFYQDERVIGTIIWDVAEPGG